MKITLKRGPIGFGILLFVSTIFLSFVDIQPINAQEDPVIVEKLKQKYAYVSYDEIGEPHGYHIALRHYDGTCGFCDENGKELVPPRYDYCIGFDNKFIMCQKNEKWGAYSLDGKLELEPGKYDYIEKYGDVYLTAVGKIGTDAKYGIFNAKLKKEVIPCIFDYIDMDAYYKTKKIFAEYKKMFGIYTVTGKRMLPCEYAVIQTFDSLSICIAAKGGENVRGTAYKPIGSKWGIYDLEKGKWLVPCEYDFIGKPAEGIMLCNKGGKIENDECVGGIYGYLDIRGNFIYPLVYEGANNFKDGVAQVTENGVTKLIENPLTGTTLSIANGDGTDNVDLAIPIANAQNGNTFAFIIANENYINGSGATFALNDGKIFKEYCQKTLGLPENNIRFIEDGTFGNMNSIMNKMKDIADVYEDDACFIIYYSGLGATDPKTKERYLLPIDASINTLQTTSYSVNKLMQEIGNMKIKLSFVILDAPFNGLDKSGSTLLAGRSVTIKSQDVDVTGNTILYYGCGNGETAYSNNDVSHGLLTYGLLEKLQQTKGECSIGEMVSAANDYVQRTALNKFDSKQTPELKVSSTLNNWNKLRLK